MKNPPSVFVIFYRQRNMTYTELCKNREGNDKYMERSMQTFNGAPKNKEVQCENIAMSDAGKNFSLILPINESISTQLSD